MDTKGLTNRLKYVIIELKKRKERYKVMYVILAKWKGDHKAEVWEVNRFSNLTRTAKMFKVYKNGFGNIYHLWIARTED